MKAAHPTVLKDLVLIGGGHSHVAVIKSFGMKPIPGVRLTIIARDVHTPYSGMLPGYVAGHYDFDDVHIDLRPLAEFAKARLYQDEAVRIDAEAKLVLCKNRPPVPYDLLSINIGSTPDVGNIPGAREFAVPVKPINRFVDRWNRLAARIAEQTGPHRIGVIGAGAGGVELLLAVQVRLQNTLRDLGRNPDDLSFHLISKSERILSGFPASVGDRFERILNERGVIVHRGAGVASVSERVLNLSDGKCIELDEMLFVTNAGAPSWLGESGLDVDEKGFLRIDDTLQVASNPDIFAVGDVATMVNHPRPKAGVFAVRQGKALTRNLRRMALSQSPKPFVPQKSILALISTGDRYAIAAKGPFTAEGKALWRWKDWIDRRFMTTFNDLPEMPEEEGAAFDPGLTNPQTLKELSASTMRCGGCGAKVGSDVLERTLSGFKSVPRNDVLIGLESPDDAAVVEVPAGKVLVQSVDYFKSFLDDPYLFGKIAANHSLNDIFAMGAEAQSALAIATVPFGIEKEVEATLNQMMAGALEVLNESGTALVGGHTSEGSDLALGFAVNGLADKTAILRKSGMRPGDVLILTKALGTGTLFAANMQQKARGRWVEAALASMVLSNQKAARSLFEHEASACTDVSGFGLLGHLLEMIRPSGFETKMFGVEAEINLSALPVLDGAAETIRAGILSTLQPANQRQEVAIRSKADARNHALYPLLFDPQTAGGLLASVPEDRAEECLTQLKASGYGAAAVIGRIGALEDGQQQPVRLV